jgi:hypothetical protein
LRKLIVAIFATAMLGSLAAAAATPEPFAPNSFSNLAHVFNAADLDRDGSMSSHEYVLLRTGTIDRGWLRDYRGNGYDRMVPTVVRGFSLLDRDDNGKISRTEFMNSANDPVRMQSTAGGVDRWDWHPEFITLTYYLMANPIDADEFDGERVVNLDGEEVGRIRDIARREQTGDYYAIIDVRGRVMDPTPTRFRSAVVGIPLEDVLLAGDGESLMLSHRGERYLLTDADLPRVNIEELREVDTLYRI